MPDERRHEVAGRQAADSGGGHLATLGSSGRGRVRGDGAHERHRGFEVAEQHQIVDMRHDRFEDVNPVPRILFHAQQVEEEQEIEVPHLGVGDRGEP